MPARNVPYVCNPKAYKEHYGRGLNDAFVGNIVQEGYGLGGLFSGLMRQAIPLLLPVLKQTAKTAGKTLVKRGSNVLKDVVLEKKNLKQSLKRHAAGGLSDILEDLGKQTGRGRPFCKKRKRRKIKGDIFD